MQWNEEIDLTGLFCPLPVIKTREKLNEMKSGQVLKVAADDPGVSADLPALCSHTGDTWLGEEKEGDVILVYIRKK